MIWYALNAEYFGRFKNYTYPIILALWRLYIVFHFVAVFHKHLLLSIYYAEIWHPD